MHVKEQYVPASTRQSICNLRTGDIRYVGIYGGHYDKTLQSPLTPLHFVQRFGRL